MKVLVTGMAGFIGYHVTAALLKRGVDVVGIDNFNDYYDPALKEARLAKLKEQKPDLACERIDIADQTAMEKFRRDHSGITHIIHLAAQAGVRYSLHEPHAYAQSNVVGHLNVLEMCRHLPELKHLVYASSSSVYGGQEKVPFAVDDVTRTPVSLYAATKLADEMMTHAYSHLFRIPATGLRFFTVYGAYGRPDMAYYSFTRALFAGEAITLFNDGKMQRDFTYIDDIVEGVLAAIDKAPEDDGTNPPCRLFNLGNHTPVELEEFVATLEHATGHKAQRNYGPMQPGDVPATYADITASQKILGFEPHTNIAEGLAHFVAWFREYHEV